MASIEPPGVPSCSLAERDRRWDLANQLMRDEGLDALLVYGDRKNAFPGSFAPDAYLTNDRPGAIVILPGNQPPIALVGLPTVADDHIQAGFTSPFGKIGVGDQIADLPEVAKYESSS